MEANPHKAGLFFCNNFNINFLSIFLSVKLIFLSIIFFVIIPQNEVNLHKAGLLLIYTINFLANFTQWLSYVKQLHYTTIEQYTVSWSL